MKIVFTMVAIAAIGFVTTANAAMVSLSPSIQTTSPGGSVTVDLNISGLGSGTALGAFDISVNFDAANLTFQDASFGDPVLGDQLDLGNLGLNGPTATAGNGTVDLIETDIFDSPSTLLAAQAHNFTLAALTFDAIANGTTPLAITLNSLADQNSNPFTAAALGASITVQPSPVPLPGTVGLLFSGLAVFAATIARRAPAAR